MSNRKVLEDRLDVLLEECRTTNRYRIFAGPEVAYFTYVLSKKEHDIKLIRRPGDKIDVVVKDKLLGDVSVEYLAKCQEVDELQSLAEKEETLEYFLKHT